MSRANFLTAKYRRTLLDGYLKQNVPLFIPNEVNRLCLQFYEDIVDWHIVGDELQDVFNAAHLACVDGPQFIIKNIPFYLKIYPNGDSSFDEGYFQLSVEYLKDKLPSNIEDFTVYFELFCDEIKYSFRKCVALGPKYIGVGWYTYCMDLEHVKRTHQLKELNIGCYAEILNIKYKNNDNKTTYFIKPISMHINYEYKWKLNQQELNLFETSSVDSSFYSPNFNNNCWCIVLIPNGWKHITHSHWQLYAKIKLLKLPFGIKRVEVKTWITVDSSKFCTSWCYSKSVDIHRPGDLDKNRHILMKNFIGSKYLAIHVIVKINKVVNNDDITIAPKNWRKCGFL